MTCRLDESNSTDALYAVARSYPGGIEALARRIGKSASVLYKKLERGDESHHLRDDEFDLLMSLCAAARVPDAYRPLRVKAWRHGHVAVKLPEFGDLASNDLATQVVKVFREGGDVASAIDEALGGDRRIDAAEGRRIESEIEQAIAALVELRERVRALAGAAAREIAVPTSLRKSS